jgi:hypothetical protein
MKVFIYRDDDGHIGAYDVDSYEQVRKVFGKVISDLCGDPEEIKGMDLEDVMMYMQEQLGVTFNNRGGKFQILDVKKQMDQFVEP